MKQKLLSRWILLSGIVISVIALAHNFFAIGMYEQLMREEALQKFGPGFAYFFVLGGTSFLFAALLMSFSCKGLKNKQIWARNVCLGSAIFVLLAQITAIVFAGFSNPLIYIVAAVSFSDTLVLLLSKFSTHQPETQKYHNND